MSLKDVFDSQDIQTGLRTCRELVELDPFNPSHGAARRGMVTALLVSLSDLLQKMKQAGHELTFADHIHPACDAENITGLIRNARNAASHPSSDLHVVNDNRIRFSYVRGYKPDAIDIHGTLFGCDFEDDSAVFFGANRVYLNRHIRRALEAAEAYFRGSTAPAGSP